MPDSLAAWTRARLATLEAGPRKALGQHFLINEGIVQKIIDLIDPHPEDQLIEIGGGLGVLSLPLAPQVGRFIVFELDHKLRGLLADDLAAIPTATVLGDALEDWQAAAPLIDATRPVKIAGNIPYQITAPLLGQVFANTLPASWQSITLMVQKEVADRMLAPAGSADRGRLSVLCEFHALPGPRFAVSREAFHPKPNVESTVLQLRPRPVALLEPHEMPSFEALIQRGFHMRRKTIWNNLREGRTNEQAESLKGYLEANGLDLKKRPQDLELREWLKVFWVEREIGMP